MEIPPSNLSREGRINEESSSSDEESFTTSTCGTQPINIKKNIICSKRKRKVKKSKKRKRAISNSQPENHIGNRNRSYSESSSSGDADFRPSNFMSIGSNCDVN